MPLPLLLLAAAAVAAGGTGIFKGASAKKHYGESKEITEHARQRYQNAMRRARRQAKATDERLASLGQLKLETYGDYDAKPPRRSSAHVEGDCHKTLARRPQAVT